MKVFYDNRFVIVLIYFQTFDVCESYFVCLQILPRSSVAVSDYTLWGAGELNTEIREAEIGIETVRTKTQEKMRNRNRYRKS